MLATVGSDSSTPSRLLERRTMASWWNPGMSEASVAARHPRKLVAWLAFVGVLALLAYGSRLIGGSDTPHDLAYRYSSSVAALVQYGIMLGVLLLIARGLPRREAFALRRPPSWKRALGLAALGLVTIYVASFVYEQVLSLFGSWSLSDEQGLVPDRWDSSRAGAFVAFFLVVTVVAPAVEELTFRGLGVSLLEPWGVTLAIVVTGILFGAAHGLVLALPVLAFFGMVVAFLRVRTGSVYPGMLLHATFNGIALIAAVSGAG
jgi:membrane protease YdiL (CAAX protease family)